MTDSNSEGYVRWLGSYFYVDGLDREDVEQEARLAAWLAPAGLERVAARRRVLDLLKASQRGKRGRAEELDLDRASSSLDVAALVEARLRLAGLLSERLSRSEREAIGRVVRGEPIRRGDKRLGQALYRFRRRSR